MNNKKRNKYCVYIYICVCASYVNIENTYVYIIYNKYMYTCMIAYTVVIVHV